mgnify:CR=1 FL=1
MMTERTWTIDDVAALADALGMSPVLLFHGLGSAGDHTGRVIA